MSPHSRPLPDILYTKCVCAGNRNGRLVLVEGLWFKEGDRDHLIAIGWSDRLLSHSFNEMKQAAIVDLVCCFGIQHWQRK